jgi:hypothetical protein
MNTAWKIAATMIVVLAALMAGISDHSKGQGANPPFLISGFINDGAGVGVEGCNVTITCIRGGIVQYGTDSDSTGAYSGDAGQTLLLAAGDIIRVTAHNTTFSGFASHTITSIDMTLGGVDSNINVTLTETPTVLSFTFLVYVIDDNALAVPNATINITTRAGTVVALLATNVSGVASVSLPVGLYTVRANATGFPNAVSEDFGIVDRQFNLTIHMTLEEAMANTHIFLGLEISTACLWISGAILFIGVLVMMVLMVARKK